MLVDATPLLAALLALLVCFATAEVLIVWRWIRRIRKKRKP